LSGPAGSATLTARYVVGCDGASSRVREAIGGALFDYRFDEPWLVIDAKVRDPRRVPKVNLQICDPARPTTCVLMGPGRHRWEFMLLPGETSDQVLDEAFIRGLLASWDCDEGIEIDRKAVYRFHGLVAETWRAGRVFLAGDAAHQMPPFAGQGLCSGLRDAANLAWKLEAALKHGAADELLDTYQLEREPHVRGYIELAIGMGLVVCALDPAIAAQRDAGMISAREAGVSPLPPAGDRPLASGVIYPGAPAAGTLFPQPWIDCGGARHRLDDVLGRGAWLIVAGRSPPAPTAVTPLIVISLENPRLAAFHAPLSTWLADHDAEAVLVRPDRYVFGAGAAEDLLRAYSTAWGATVGP